MRVATTPYENSIINNRKLLIPSVGEDFAEEGGY
jgi:hypothetical protein